MMTSVVEEAMKLQRDFPDIMAGFDAVGETEQALGLMGGDLPLGVTACFCGVQVGREDSGRPLWYFREALSLPAQKGVTLPFYFHAGETGEFTGGCFWRKPQKADTKALSDLCASAVKTRRGRRWIRTCWTLCC